MSIQIVHNQSDQLCIWRQIICYKFKMFCKINRCSCRLYKVFNPARMWFNDAGGLGYHFWTSVLEKLNHFKKKEEPDQLSKVENAEHQKIVLEKIRAIECFVQLCCIAMGTIQLISFHDEAAKEIGTGRYLRTERRKTLSEASVIHYLRRHFFIVMAANPSSTITHIIQTAQNWKNRKKECA